MDIFSEINEAEKEQSLSIPAKRLSERLSLLKNGFQNSQKRWFWELLQNASDYNTKVNISLILSDEKLVFQHDGSPFSVLDVLNVISPDSNKTDDEIHRDNIGKFGTGLVSTHILSSIMDVRGICIGNDAKRYRFDLHLDRSCYNDKKKMMAQIDNARKYFRKEIIQVTKDSDDITEFSYLLGHHLPGVKIIESKDINLGYIKDILPYTLCFMPKVISVKIKDLRTNAKVKSYSIERSFSDRQTIKFKIAIDNEIKEKEFAYFELNNVSTAIEIKNKNIVPFPKNISKLFCGLPLIGTENVGLPFILNSTCFEPTIERTGVEIEEDSESPNLNLFDDSIELYSILLDFIEQNHLRNANNVIRMNEKFNGNDESKDNFKNNYLIQYKDCALEHSIFQNSKGEFIKLEDGKVPYENSKLDKELYKLAELVIPKNLPASKDYKGWGEALNFSLFKDLKFTCEDLVDKIEEYSNISEFGSEYTPKKIKNWLKDCTSYVEGINAKILEDHNILPNQNGGLCDIGSLYIDYKLPGILKNAYDKFSEDDSIEDKLLDKSFNDLKLNISTYSLSDLAADVDQKFQEYWTSHISDLSGVGKTINQLYIWTKKYEEKNGEKGSANLKAWFEWYYPKRAKLVLDFLGEDKLNQSLIIADSGKMEALTKLAESDLSLEEISKLSDNIEILRKVINNTSDIVDDKKHADLEEGDYGEKIVYNDLKNKFTSENGYKVIWSSKEKNEARFDFEVRKGNRTVLYCDAKTTGRGTDNADSIPFFMRKSQWEFLQVIKDTVPYYIARVFLKNNGTIFYLRIQLKIK